MPQRICPFCKKKVSQRAYIEGWYLGWHKNPNTGVACKGSEKNVDVAIMEAEKENESSKTRDAELPNGAVKPIRDTNCPKCHMHTLWVECMNEDCDYGEPYPS